MGGEGEKESSVLFCLHGPESHHGGSTFMTSGNPNYLPETHLQMPSQWGSGLVHLGMTCVQLPAAAMSSLHLSKEPRLLLEHSHNTRDTWLRHQSRGGG